METSQETYHKRALGTRQCMSLLKYFPRHFIDKDGLTLGFEGFKSAIFRYPSKFLILDWKTIKLFANVSNKRSLLCPWRVSLVQFPLEKKNNDNILGTVFRT